MVATPTTTGVILAGGRSQRMGRDKALLPVGDTPLIELVFRRLQQVLPDIVVVAKQPERYDFLPCNVITDQFEGAGPLVGIHAALDHCTTAGVFVVACDMPLLQVDLIRHQVALGADWEVVVPTAAQHVEPLHAWYSRNCLPTILDQLMFGRRRVTSFFDLVRVKRLTEDEIRQHDPRLLSCTNINTPEQLTALAKDVDKGDLSPD